MLSSSTLPHGLLQGFSLEAISLYPLALCTIIYWIFLVKMFSSGYYVQRTVFYCVLKFDCLLVKLLRTSVNFTKHCQ